MHRDLISPNPMYAKVPCQVRWIRPIVPAARDTVDYDEDSSLEIICSMWQKPSRDYSYNSYAEKVSPISSVGLELPDEPIEGFLLVGAQP